MLRIHCMQLFYNLSDPGNGRPLCMRLNRCDGLPDYGFQTRCRTRRRSSISVASLKRHKLGEKLFAEINNHLSDHGLMIARGQHR